MNWLYFCISFWVGVVMLWLGETASIVGALCFFLAGGFLERGWKAACPNRPGIES